MDILCFHSSEEIREDISRHLEEMDLSHECHPLMEVEDIARMQKEKRARILLVEFVKESMDKYPILRDLTFTVPLIKSIDREIAIYFEQMDVDYIISDQMNLFKSNFMRVLLHNASEVKDFLREERIYKNIVYAYGFSWGHSYIVDMERSEEVFKLLPIFAEGIDLFVALREKPTFLGKHERMRIVWVTDLVGKDRIKPHNLTILTDSIIKFLEGGEKRIVVLDCIEYLLLYNDFINVLRNIELINSYAMEYNSLVIIIIDNNAYTTKEYSLLKRYSILWKGV